jgi:hypothetical protein
MTDGPTRHRPGSALGARSGRQSSTDASKSKEAFTISTLELQVASLQRQVEELKSQLANNPAASMRNATTNHNNPSRSSTGSLISDSSLSATGDNSRSTSSAHDSSGGAVRTRSHNEALCFLSAVSSNHYEEFLQFIISLR